MRDIDIKVLKIGIYLNPMDFEPTSFPSDWKWSRYLADRLAAVPWLQEVVELPSEASITEGVVGSRTLAGSLAVSPDKALILKKLEEGDEVLATLFTLTYPFESVGYFKQGLGQRPDLTTPLIGLDAKRGYPQLVRLKKVGNAPLEATGVKPIKGLSYEWSISPLKRTGTAYFLDEKLRRRFLEEAEKLGLEVEHVHQEERSLPFKRTDRVSNRKYLVDYYTYQIPAELDVAPLWRVIGEQVSELDRKRVNLKRFNVKQASNE